MPIRTILVDDHPVVIEGIKNTLENDERFEVIGEFQNGRELLHSLLPSTADILLLDLNMPQTDGMKVLEELKNTKPSPKTIVISAYNSQKLVDECKLAGAAAFIIKTENLSSLTDIIERVMNGEKIFPDSNALSDKSEDKFSYLDQFLIKHRLTKREVEIIRMICKGKTNNNIADQLSLSVFTVGTHRRNIFRKLSLDNSNPMALYEFASTNGLL